MQLWGCSHYAVAYCPNHMKALQEANIVPKQLLKICITSHFDFLHQFGWDGRECWEMIKGVALDTVKAVGGSREIGILSSVAIQSVVTG